MIILKSIISIGVLSIASSLIAAEYHLSPTGNDHNPGTAASPLVSPQKARDMAKSGDRIVLHSGIYQIKEALVFGPQHSGVTWVAAAGEHPVISGGVAVTGWTAGANGIWQTKLDRQGKLRQLCVNGKSAAIAEGPVVKPLAWSGEFIITGKEPWAVNGPGKAPDGYRIRKTDLPAMPNTHPPDVEFRQTRTWNHHWLCFREIKEDGGDWFAGFGQPAAAAATNIEPWIRLSMAPITLFNAYEFIDQAGEFYHNTHTGTLYYKPHPGEDMATATVIAPVLERLVSVRGGDLQDRVSNLRFEGITFAHTAYNLFEIGGSRGHIVTQSNAVQCNLENRGGGIYGGPLYIGMDVAPSAISVTNASGISFHRCTFRHLGCLALNFENDVVNSAVIGNVFRDIEGGGINVGHPQHIYIGKMNGGNRGYGPYDMDNSHDKYDEAREGLCGDFTISNNLFRNIATRQIGMIPISVFYGRVFRVEHNDMAELPYSGISIGWGWSEGSPFPNKTHGAGKFWTDNMDGGKPSHSLHNYTVANNRVTNFCNTLHDGGGIYTLAYAEVNFKDDKPAVYSKITGNYLSTRSTHADHCVYPDEGSGSIEIARNVFDIPSLLQAFQHQVRAGKHDLQYHGNHINVEAVSGREYESIPHGSSYRDNHYFKPTAKPTPHDQWSAEAQAIMTHAGLQPDYRDLLDP